MVRGQQSQRHVVKRHAFTLVELLVVLGIITLLVGILMPALSRARASSQKVACLANLSELGKAFTMYLNDSHGHLPYVNPLPSTPEPASSPYVFVNVYPPIQTVLDPYISQKSKVWQCPCDRITTDTPGAPQGAETYWQREGSSYQYNPFLSYMYAWKKFADVESTKEGHSDMLPVLYDFETFHGSTGSKFADALSTSHAPAGTNYLFSDMHAGDL